MGYRDGFFAKTEDDRFGIKIGSRLNFGYTYGFVSGENLSSFDIQHAKFYIGGNAFGQTIQYYIQAAAANNTRRAGLGPLPETTNQGFILEDYYVRIQLEGMDLKAGQFKVPFARQWMIYSGNLDFVNRSAATQAFMFGRDRGVTLSRYTDSFSWSMGAFNGAGTIQTPNPFQLQTGQNISNDTAQKGMMYITRLAISPFGPLGYSEGDVEQTEGSKFEMGGTFAFDHHRDYDLNLNGTVDDSDVSTLNGAGDLTYKREGFSFQGEYFYRRHQASLVPNFTSHGFYAQPAYFVMPRKLELALRFSWLDPSGIVGNDQITETSGALNYYLSGDHRFKTQLQYTWLKRESITGNDDDSFLDLSLQVTI
jgi:phosphate-selective porin OprO/OprP